MTADIKKAAESSGIIAFILDSEAKLETQLNNINRDYQDPVMLIGWDINTSLSFDQNGFLDNPESDITALLVGKSEDSTRDSYQQTSDEMATLFLTFIKTLNDNLVSVQLSTNDPITDISYIAVPKYGSGKHSGILAKWKMKSAVTNCV